MSSFAATAPVKEVVSGSDHWEPRQRRAAHPLVAHAITQLKELHDLVSRISVQGYAEPVPVLSQASIGQHVRHILEFHLCLMEARKGEVDYDARVRDKELETERGAALVKLEKLSDWLNGLKNDAPLTLIADHSLDGSAKERMATSLFRELAYAFDHAIHHMALLRIGIAQQHPEIELDPDFGVAPSTIRNRKQCAR